MKRLGFVEFWRIIPVFAQGKKSSNYILEILKRVKSSVQATASLGVAGKATGSFEKKKKNCAK